MRGVAFATAVAVWSICAAARGEVMVTADPTIGAGGVPGRSVHLQYGLYASLMVGPRADEKEWTFPVGAYVYGGAVGDDTFGSLGLTVAALGAPSKELTPLVLSVGPISVERGAQVRDGTPHLGALFHASWGVWGPTKWVYKAVSASVFVDVRAIFARDGLPAENQLVVGVQVNPIAVFGALLAFAVAGSGVR